MKSCNPISFKNLLLISFEVIWFLFINCSFNVNDYLNPQESHVYYDFGSDTSSYLVKPPIIILKNATFDSLKIGTQWKFYISSLDGNPDYSTSSSEFVTVTLVNILESYYKFSVEKSSGNFFYSIAKNDTSMENEFNWYVSIFWSKDTVYPTIKLDSNGAYQHVILKGNYPLYTREMIISNKFGTIYRLWDNNDKSMRGYFCIKLIEFNGKKVEFTKIFKEITAKDGYLTTHPLDTIIN